jgi:thioredoxin 1
MDRRHFIATTLCAAAAFTLTGRAALAAMIDYSDTEDQISAALAEGKTVFVDYQASWCSTCAAQKRVIEALMADNPAYAENITFVKVDWDQYGEAPVTTSRNIPRRSTLIVLKGEDELGRIVAGTGKAEIKALMDTALAAATGA